VFGLHGGKLDRLAQVGFPELWTRALRALLTNATQPLEHHGPVTIKTVQGSGTLTAAARAKQAPPADATLTAPALALFNYGGRALHTQAGHVIFDGQVVDPKFAGAPGVPSLGTGDRVNVRMPMLVNHYSWFNWPVHINDDIRMGQDLIFKYSTPSYGSSIRRFKLTANMSGGKAVAIPIDWLGAQCGNAFTVYDMFGSSDSQFSCGTKGMVGYAIYFSDGANLGAGGGAAAAAADCAIRPNIGNWAVAMLDTTKADVSQTINLDVPVKICCVNGKIIVCTQRLTLRVCQGAASPLGALDCGGSDTCT